MAISAAGTWSTSGPPGRPHEVVFDPVDSSRAYATTQSGLYRSDDAGRSWKLSNLKSGIFELVISPSNPAVLYAYALGGLARSSDRGESWTLASASPLAQATALAVDPRNPDTVYASGVVNTLTLVAVILRSTDGGRHWDPPMSFSFGRSLPPLFATGSPESGTVLAMASVGVGARTSDGGWTWQFLPLLFPPGSDSLLALAADLSPVSSGFYAVTRGAVYNSRDAGASWSVVGPSPSGCSSSPCSTLDRTTNVAVRAGVLFAATDRGVFRNGGGGGTWQQVLAEPASSVALATANGSVVLAAAGIDVWRSEDGGGTFVADMANFLNAQVTRLVVDSSDRVFAFGLTGLGGPVFLRFPFGQWRVFSTAPPSAVFTLDLNDPDTQYLAPLSEACPALMKSVDAGRTWTPMGIAGCRVEDMSVDPNDSTRLIVVKEDGIFLSRDAGATWNHSLVTPPGRHGPLRFDRRRPGRVYAGFYTSGDGGATWTSGMTPCLDPSPSVCGGIAMAIDNRTGRVYEAYFESNLLLAASSDFGATWSMLPVADFPFGLRFGGVATRDLDVDPTTGDLLAATVFGVYRSSDGGLHFGPVDHEHLESEVASVRARADGSLFAARGLVWELGPDGARAAPIVPPRRRRGSTVIPPRAVSGSVQKS